MRCAIWYHMYNLKNVKNTHREVLVTKSNTPPWVFFTLFNCTNGTKSRNISHVVQDGKMEYNDLRKSRLLDRFSIHKGTQTEIRNPSFGWEYISKPLKCYSVLVAFYSLLVVY